MNNRFTKIVVTLATVTGISFSAGQVSADSINAVPQANGQAQGEAKVEKRLDADHMKGMDGATAVIESAEDTTVYMLDFTTTTGEKE